MRIRHSDITSNNFTDVFLKRTGVTNDIYQLSVGQNGRFKEAEDKGDCKLIPFSPLLLPHNMF